MFSRSRGEQYRDRPPLLALDDASLDGIDAEMEQARSGSARG